MSSLLLVQRVEKVGEEEPRIGPLYVKDMLVYPEPRRAGQQGRERDRVLLHPVSRHGIDRPRRRPPSS